MIPQPAEGVTGGSAGWWFIGLRLVKCDNITLDLTMLILALGIIRPTRFRSGVVHERIICWRSLKQDFHRLEIGPAAIRQKGTRELPWPDCVSRFLALAISAKPQCVSARGTSPRAALDLQPRWNTPGGRMKRSHNYP